MRSSVLLLTVVLVAAGSMWAGAMPAPDAPPTRTGRYVITGDLSPAYVSGEFVLFTTAKASKAAGGMTPARSMTPANGMTPAKKDGAAPGAPAKLDNEIARATLTDGRFVVEGTVSQVQSVYFYVMDGTSPSGHRMAPMKGQLFILEPGRLKMTMNAHYRFSIAGGHYNDAVYGWRESKAYLETEALKNDAFRTVPGETEAKKSARLERGTAYQNALFDLETQGRKTTAQTHPDVFVRQLAIQTAWLGGPWMLEGARGILEMDPDNAWAIGFIAKEEARLAKRERNEQIGRVGGAIKDFDATTISGDVVSLSSVCSGNRYVLLEFWASWCGPCRVEIPHMKKAYARYHDKGFEIFSFTLDDKKDAWITASEKEQLPWVNTGMGRNAKPVKLYEVTGVPANYLVDGETGEVIARNLRGDALDKKLHELLGDAS